MTVCHDADVVIVGAGIAGLVAARDLVAGGSRVVILEKARGVGGRMATRRLGDAVCDHGAQFFTVRQPAFESLIDQAHASGAVDMWCDGFVRGVAGGALEPAGDGHPRWRGRSGMTALPKHLASSLDATACSIRRGAKATAVAVGADGVTVTVEDGGPVRAAAAILTAPVPQTLDLLSAGHAAGGAGFDESALRMLAAIDYDPCFALMLVLDRPSLVPPPGGIQFDGNGPPAGSIAWVADNFQKGISPVPALTIHATGAFSREHFDAPPEEVSTLLLAAAAPWIDGGPESAIVERSLHRWKFAQPTSIVPESMAAVSTTPPVVCCGDAFAGPKVEGAAVSGMAAAQWIRRLMAGGKS